MSAPKLVLHPEPSAPAPDPETVLAALRKLGVIGLPFELDGRPHYRTGPGFLDHLTFLGCAPSIELDPPTAGLDEAARAGRFCHVRVHAPTPQPQARYRAGQGPRCRACRRDVPPEALNPPQDLFICSGCGRSTPAAGLNWRQTGGCSRLFLDIWGIHTGEAVPGELLLERLGGAWRFFYTED